MIITRMRRPRLTRKRFAALRVAVWGAQVPVAVATGLKSSLPYLMFISLAALIESAWTDFDQARRDEQEANRRP